MQEPRARRTDEDGISKYLKADFILMDIIARFTRVCDESPDPPHVEALYSVSIHTVGDDCSQLTSAKIPMTKARARSGI